MPAPRLRPTATVRRVAPSTVHAPGGTAASVSRVAAAGCRGERTSSGQGGARGMGRSSSSSASGTTPVSRAGGRADGQGERGRGGPVRESSTAAARQRRPRSVLASAAHPPVVPCRIAAVARAASSCLTTCSDLRKKRRSSTSRTSRSRTPDSAPVAGTVGVRLWPAGHIARLRSSARRVSGAVHGASARRARCIGELAFWDTFGRRARPVELCAGGFPHESPGSSRLRGGSPVTVAPAPLD